MGNAPLPSPPAPTATTKIVWSITTKSEIFGTRLHVLSVEGGESGESGESETPTTTPAAAAAAADDEEEEPQPRNFIISDGDGSSVVVVDEETRGGGLEVRGGGEVIPTPPPRRPPPHDDDHEEQDCEENEEEEGPTEQQQQQQLVVWKRMPSLLREQTDLSPQAYTTKIEEFIVLLNNWKGGQARLLILIWALVIVVGFVGAYFIPGFWQSVIFSTPIYLPIIVVVQFTFLAIFGRWERIHNRRLLLKTNELFHGGGEDDWLLRYKVHVKFYRVANLAGSYVMTRNGLRRRQKSSGHRHGDRSGNFCYVLVMTLVTEEEALALIADDGTVGMSVIGGGGANDDDDDDDGTTNNDDADADDLDSDSLDNDFSTNNGSRSSRNRNGGINAV